MFALYSLQRVITDYVEKYFSPQEVLGFDLDGGVPLKLWNPYPFLSVIFGQKMYPFLGIFLKI